MNEVNALVWPSPGGVGVLDPIGWNQTVQVAKDGRDHQAGPVDDGLRHHDRRRGPPGIEGDTTGAGFTKAEVAVTPGGN